MFPKAACLHLSPPSAHRLGRDVPPTVEPPLPRACLEEYSWTCATDVGQSESCWTQSSSAVFCFQGLAVSSLADTPSEYCRCAGDKAPAGLPGRSVSLACQPSGCADRHIEGNQAGGQSWKHRRETLEGAALPSFLPGCAQVPLAPVTHHGTQSRQDKLSSPVPHVAPGQVSVKHPRWREMSPRTFSALTFTPEACPSRF